jgi:hypothetical protein
VIVSRRRWVFVLFAVAATPLFAAGQVDKVNGF